MKPAAPESAPPIRNPIAGRMSDWTMASSTASGSATTAMIVYWRFR